MTDTIIKGSGNSRFFKGPPNFLTMFPDYQSFGQAVAAGEVPFDLLGPNPAGCEQIGDNLNKETLLKDTTAALYGKGSNASPDDILAAIRPLITAAGNAGLHIQTGSYTGAGSNGMRTISFVSPGITALLLLISSDRIYGKNTGAVFAIKPQSVATGINFYGNESGKSFLTGSISWAGNSVNLEASYSNLDVPSLNYKWAIIGTKV